MGEDKKRLTSAEQQAVMNLFACIDTLGRVVKPSGKDENGEYVRNPLEKRLGGVPRGEQKMKTALTQLINATTDMLTTAPVEQIEHIKRNLKHLRVWVYIGNAVNRRDSDDGRWFSINEMNDMAMGIREACSFCTKSPQEQRSCPYGKLLDKLPADKDEKSNGCGWYETLGSLG